MASLVDLTALDKFFVPDIPNRADGFLTSPCFHIESRVFCRALASIVILDVSMIDFTFVYAFFSGGVIDLPGAAVAG